MNDETKRVTRIRELLAGAKPAEAPTLTADDTLGRILRRCEPWANRYVRCVGAFGLVLLPLKLYQIYQLAGGGLFRTNDWINQHDPLFILKVLGASCFLAGMVLLFWLALATERERRRLKRGSKNH